MRRQPPQAQVLELVDKLDLGSSALVACGFDSRPGHQPPSEFERHSIAP